MNHFNIFITKRDLADDHSNQFYTFSLSRMIILNWHQGIVLKSLMEGGAFLIGAKVKWNKVVVCEAIKFTNKWVGFFFICVRSECLHLQATYRLHMIYLHTHRGHRHIAWELFNFELKYLIRSCKRWCWFSKPINAHRFLTILW